MTIDGVLSYLTMYDEVTWGTKPTTPTYVHVPVTDYGVKFNVENRQSALYSGLHQRKHSRNWKGMPAGSISLPAFGYWIDNDGGGNDKSLFEYIMEWAFNSLDGTFLDSRGCEWAEGPNSGNLRHQGLRVNSLTLAGDEGSGGITLTLDVMGQSEVTFATAQTLPNDREKLGDFEFADITLTIDSTEVNPSSFQLTISNGLSPKNLNSRTPTLLPRTQCQIDFQFSIYKSDDTYAAYHRAVSTDQDLDIQLDLVGPHNGTGTSGDNTTCQIDMPVCRLINPDDARARDLTLINCQTNVLKPDSAEDSVNFTYGVS